jgi:DNA-binding NarL/FixJ family response regulator
MNLAERQEEMKERTTPVRRTPQPRQLAAVDLTEHERNVIRMIFGGHSNEAIASSLQTSRQTVKNALCSACKKLEVDGIRGLFPLVIAAQRENLTKLLVSE